MGIRRTGGEDRVSPWGGEPPTVERAAGCEMGCVGTSPTGSRPAGASRWGLLNMTGNVAKSTSTDAAHGGKELRGGSWRSDAVSLRTTGREA